MGFPTANIWPQAGMMAQHGVYITRVRLLDDPQRPALPGITNLGLRPTVTQTDQANAETLILQDLGPEADLYGRPIQVELLRFVRPEQRFDSIDALKAQIARDVQEARAFHQIQP
jgi:riboflavin kinase/FMN adenylyltransferase